MSNEKDHGAHYGYSLAGVVGDSSSRRRKAAAGGLSVSVRTRNPHQNMITAEVSERLLMVSGWQPRCAELCQVSSPKRDDFLRKRDDFVLNVMACVCKNSGFGSSPSSPAFESSLYDGRRTKPFVEATHDAYSYNSIVDEVREL